MKYIASSLYLDEMETNTKKYGVQDIQEYKAAKDFKHNDIALEKQTTLEKIYSIYNPSKTSTDIASTLDRYRTHESVLFQRLYRKYVDPEYKVDESDEAYPTITII